MKKVYKVKVNEKVYEVELLEVNEVEGTITSKPGIESNNTSNATGNSATIAAPMPGNIFKIEVAVGDQVKKGQVVAVLEAMKMETEIVSPSDGKISSIVSNVGAQVELGDTIITIN